LNGFSHNGDNFDRLFLRCRFGNFCFSFFVFSKEVGQLARREFVTNLSSPLNFKFSAMTKQNHKQRSKRRKKKSGKMGAKDTQLNGFQFHKTKKPKENYVSVGLCVSDLRLVG
jgi:hypothetical protein